MSDFPKFCTSCGAMLEPGQKFCTSCGAAIPLNGKNRSTGAVPPAVSAEAPNFKPGNTSPMPVIDASYAAGNTQVFKSADETTRQYRQPCDASSFNSGSQDSHSSKKPLVVLIAVLAVIVCALVGILFGVISSNANQGNSNDPVSSQSTSSEEGDVDSTTNSNPANEKSSSSSDKAVYDTLCGYYSRLGSYDDKIASSAKSFNANYLSKDMSKRSSCASSATSLQEEIEKDYSALKNISIPSDSQYASSYSAMLTCYYDCTQRIGAIVESWNNSLQYSDPTGHEDSICEPLSRDKSGDNNKYYTEFKKTYPSAKPASPA